MWMNDIKCKYMSMFPFKNSAHKELICYDMFSGWKWWRVQPDRWKVAMLGGMFWQFISQNFFHWSFIHWLSHVNYIHCHMMALVYILFTTTTALLFSNKLKNVHALQVHSDPTTIKAKQRCVSNIFRVQSSLYNKCKIQNIDFMFHPICRNEFM